jgi:hypothetical protein
MNIDVNDEHKIGSSKKFDIVLDALRDVYKEVIDSNLKVAGVLLIVLGWFASNQNPLSMLCRSIPLAYLSLLFTALGGGLLFYLFWLLYCKSQTLYIYLVGHGYEEILFSRFKVTKGMLWCGLFGQFTMLLGIFTLLYVKYVALSTLTCTPLK